MVNVVPRSMALSTPSPGAEILSYTRTQGRPIPPSCGLPFCAASARLKTWNRDPVCPDGLGLPSLWTVTTMRACPLPILIRIGVAGAPYFIALLSRFLSARLRGSLPHHAYTPSQIIWKHGPGLMTNSSETPFMTSTMSHSDRFNRKHSPL